MEYFFILLSLSSVYLVISDDILDAGQACGESVQYGDKALQLVWFLEPQINKNPCIFWEIGICFSGNFRFGEEFKQPSRIQSTLSNSNSLGDHENVRITKGQLFDAPIPGVYKYQTNRGRRSLVADTSKVWPNGVIPYSFGSGLSASGQRLIRGAMELWEKNTCIKFVKRTKENDYIYLYKGRGCCSHVGRRRGKQNLSLGLGCLRHGIVVHELGHAIGFWHEQNRPDRGSFIEILYKNVELGKSINFDLIDEGNVQTLDQDYDYQSIMHYGSKFFNRNGGDTIRPKDFYRINPRTIGSRYYSYSGNVLSRLDILKANIMYKCTKLTECGGTTFKADGSIAVSPNSTAGGKRPEKDCIWVINRNESISDVQFSQTLTLIFEEFQVGHRDPNTDYCHQDYVVIREGKGFLSPFLTALCGHHLPEAITTFSDSLYVKLHTTSDVVGLRESLPKFRIRYKQDHCSKTFVGLRDTIESEGFPSSYPIDTDCLWRIKLPEGYHIVIRFHSFGLRLSDPTRECADYLDIMENGKETTFKGRYCGSQSPGEVRLQSNEATLHLHTTNALLESTAPGFSASYFAEDVNECLTGQHKCDLYCLNYNGGYACACLPGYRPVYIREKPNGSCLDIDECADKNGGCSHECVNTDGGFFCICPPGHLLAANNTCVDVDECRPPFSYCSHHCHNTIGSYQCSCPIGFILQPDRKTCKELSRCLGKWASLTGTIESPDIPTSYAKEVNCRWTVNIHKNYGLVIDFHLPWQKNIDCKSFIIVKSQRHGSRRLRRIRICSNSDLTQKMDLKSSFVTIEYHAKAPYLPGFTLQYHSVQLDPVCGEEITSLTGQIRTPGYPYRYPSKASCVWKIKGIKGLRTRIEFVDFSVEFSGNCSFDYLVVEEYNSNQSVAKRIGRFCGNKSPSSIVISSFNDVILKFVSDATIRKKGVHLRFSKF